MNVATKRKFQDIETKEEFRLYQDSDTSVLSLISEGSKALAKGTEVNGFYICAHTSVTLKINNSKIVKLPTGSFYNIKEGEKITHLKYCGFKKFTKVNCL